MSKYRVVEIIIEGNLNRFQIQRRCPTWFGIFHKWQDDDKQGHGYARITRLPVNWLLPVGSLQEAQSYLRRWEARVNKKSKLVFETEF